MYPKTLLVLTLITFHSILFTQDLSDSLLLHYNWNGTFEDQSGNDYHGLATGTSFVEDRFGNPGKACYFNGISDFIELPNLTELKPELPVTIAFWLKYEDLYYEYVSVFNTSFENDRNTGVYFNISNASLKYAVNYGDGDLGYTSAGARTLLSSHTADTDEWHHITLVVEGPTDMEIYIDCEATGESYQGSGGSLTYSLGGGTIGKHDRNTGDPGDFLKGYLDDFKYWNRALSEDEILEVCNEREQVSSIEEQTFENNSNDQISVFPNPAMNTINISASYPDEYQSMQITDVFGKVMFSGKYLKEFDISSFSDGIYLVQLVGNNRTSTTRFIKSI
jgi:hypothetical protein